VVGVGELGLGPAQVDVAGGLQHPLPADDPLPVVPVPARRQVVLQDRGDGLLELQEQRVVLVATLKKDDVGQGADAADPDTLRAMSTGSNRSSRWRWSRSVAR
jgi:hypothetical protein